MRNTTITNHRFSRCGQQSRTSQSIAAVAGRVGMSFFFLAVAFMPATIASEFYADQENQVPISAGWSAVLLAPIGHSSMPSNSGSPTAMQFGPSQRRSR